ncbi:MAG: hypothetical protein P0S93_04395 [Candidatus Neptunochlamydia sp.]|nr:hypothetical protein [Candidatus Neptunochlamydia sp.]
MATISVLWKNRQVAFLSKTTIPYGVLLASHVAASAIFYENPSEKDSIRAIAVLTTKRAIKAIGALAVLYGAFNKSDIVKSINMAHLGTSFVSTIGTAVILYIFGKNLLAQNEDDESKSMSGENPVLKKEMTPLSANQEAVVYKVFTNNVISLEKEKTEEIKRGDKNSAINGTSKGWALLDESVAIQPSNVAEMLVGASFSLPFGCPTHSQKSLSRILWGEDKSYPVPSEQKDKAVLNQIISIFLSK